MSKASKETIFMGAVQRALKQKIVDTLCITNAERILGRPLFQDELEELRQGNLIFTQNQDRIWFSFKAKIYKFPTDLQPSWVPDLGESSGNFFEDFFPSEEEEPGDL